MRRWQVGVGNGLAKSAAKFHEHLDRLDGAVEIDAYLTFDESAAIRVLFDENLDLAAARIRLGELVAHRLSAWRRARSEVLLEPEFEESGPAAGHATTSRWGWQSVRSTGFR